ncbi:MULTISPECIES: ASCH domain-containing protein [Aeromonas]|uniref:ASCH domain-containing protein n=1 Tax=Aeromonas TaxID=642 RepID=UPI0019569790|nr:MULTISPECIES: ASCH domain-containing protein [Aeromonas]UUM68329.1 ASCH domain-containing protein [Aeromonas veronii]
MVESMNPACSALAESYLLSLPVAARARHVSADYFCADAHNANLCASLVVAGRKRATCSLAYWYLEKGERMPEQGDLLVVTDWSGLPKALVEIVSVTLCPFDEVDAAFAAEEGEGDGSQAWWREAHKAFFEREMKAEGREFDEHATLVLERFRVVALPQ